mmetsp:Transcript_24977/g.77819  ORF Transcript_24977/g.77819 Transcript_24977/m.77819 type:complete len:251 (-) Transcript_24977:167-919(-)
MTRACPSQSSSGPWTRFWQRTDSYQRRRLSGCPRCARLSSHPRARRGPWTPRWVWSASPPSAAALWSPTIGRTRLCSSAPGPSLRLLLRVISVRRTPPHSSSTRGEGPRRACPRWPWRCPRRTSRPSPSARLRWRAACTGWKRNSSRRGWTWRQQTWCLRRCRTRGRRAPPDLGRTASLMMMRRRRGRGCWKSSLNASGRSWASAGARARTRTRTRTRALRLSASTPSRAAPSSGPSRTPFPPLPLPERG